MPCLILTGLPCVGKTTLAEKIKERALQHSSGRIKSVVVVNEEMACPGQTKAQCYATSHSEKKTRGALKACFDQVVVGKSTAEGSKQQLVILDSMNYIKGFRYELFCISKAAGKQHAVIWALNPMELSRDWNRARNNAENQFYSEELMEELIQRFEPPDERNRWDKPLYKVDMRPQELKKVAAAEGEILGKSVYNMHALSDVMGKTAISSDANSDVFPQGGSGSEKQGGNNNNNDTSVPKKKAFKGFKRASKSAKSVPASYVSPASTDQASSQAAPPAVGSLENDTPVLFPKNFLYSSGPSETEPAKDGSSMADGGDSNSPDTAIQPNRPPSSKAAQPDNKPVFDTNAPLDEQIDAILDAFLLHVQPLVQGTSTRQHVAGSANALHEMDSITQSICDAIVQGQTQTTVVGRIPISLTANGGVNNNPDRAKRQLFLDTSRRLPQAELRRLRKQYLRWVATHPPDDGTEHGIAQSFVTYIQAQL